VQPSLTLAPPQALGRSPRTPCNVILVRLVAFDQPAYELLAAALEQSP
jgi:hypothetical protein